MGCPLSMLQKKKGDGEKKEKGSLTVVFKVDCLCEGCASKILKCVREFEGINIFPSFSDDDNNKVWIFPVCERHGFYLVLFLSGFWNISSVFFFRGGDSENGEQLKQSDSDRSCGSNGH